MSVIKSAEKVLKVLKALRGHSLQGISNQDLAQQLNESPAQIHRALQTLIAEGLARQEENGLFTLAATRAVHALFPRNVAVTGAGWKSTETDLP